MTSVSPGGVTTSAVIVWRWLTSRTRCLRTLGRTTSRDADSEHEFWTRSRQATPSPRAGVSQMVDYATGEPPRVAVEHPVEMSVELTLLIGADDVFVVTEPPALPPAGVQVQDPAGLGPEAGVAGEESTIGIATA